MARQSSLGSRVSIKVSTIHRPESLHDYLKSMFHKNRIGPAAGYRFVRGLRYPVGSVGLPAFFRQDRYQEGAMPFAEMFRYKAWADRRTLDAVAAIDGTRHPEALAFALQQLNHMVRVEEVFRARLQGRPEPHASTNSDPVPGLVELDRRLTASNAWLLPQADTLVPAQRDEVIRFRFLDGKAGALSRAEILFHLINHGTYHRGAIGRALDQAGGLRPADTYTVFIHAAEPERRGDGG